MSRTSAIATCLLVMLAGFLVGTVAVFALPWSAPSDVWVAILVGLAFGFVEVNLIFRFGNAHIKRLLLLDGYLFPFASVGMAVAMMVFGIR